LYAEFHRESKSAIRIALALLRKKTLWTKGVGVGAIFEDKNIAKQQISENLN
jgi:hypothetical protein